MSVTAAAALRGGYRQGQVSEGLINVAVASNRVAAFKAAAMPFAAGAVVFNKAATLSEAQNLLIENASDSAELESQRTPIILDQAERTRPPDSACWFNARQSREAAKPSTNRSICRACVESRVRLENNSCMTAPVRSIQSD